MRTSILLRLVLGGALIAMIALGALAMRAALPTPETHDVSTARPVPASDADPVLTVEAQDSAPVAAASGASTPTGAAVRSPGPQDTPDPSTAVAPTECADLHSAVGCPNGGDAGVATSRPTVATETDHAPARTSTGRASHAERRVSSGPMRMLGGGESTW